MSRGAGGWSRREVARGLAGLAVLPALEPLVAHAGEERGVAEESGASATAKWPGYDRAIVIDGLAGAFDSGGEEATVPLPEKVLAAIAASGMTAVNSTLPYPGDDFEATVRRIAFVEAAAQAHADRLLIVRRAADVDRAKAEGKLGVIMGFQSTEMLGSDLSRIEVFQRLGVRVMQLTYNDRSPFGDGCLEPAGAGLSKLGHEAVERMNALGVAVDLSHAGTRTTADGIAASSKPVLISHTGCNALFRHPRNNDDRELRAVSEGGGVVGIYLMPFLDGGSGPVTAASFLAHLEHALDVCGSDGVGIGSDQGIVPVDDTPEYRKRLREEVEARQRAGISAPGESPDRPPFIPELNSARRMELIAAAMAGRGIASAVIDKVLGGNFRRVFGDIWGG